MTYIFSGIAFIILIPIILLLPLGVRPLTKFVILLLSFCLGIVGIVAEPFIGKLQLGLITILLVIVFTLLVDKIKKQVPKNSKSMTSRKKELLIQDQEVESKKLIPVKFVGNDKTINTEDNENNIKTEEVIDELVPDHDQVDETIDDSTIDFVENYEVQEEVSVHEEVAVSIDDSFEEQDWLNEISINEEIETNKSEDKDKEDVGSLDFIHNIDEILQENTDFVEQKETVPIDFEANPLFSDLEELEVVLNETYEDDIANKEQEISSESEMETLEVLSFDRK
ncbi:hypothetical protein [Fredinandcohnia sp. 179-A 10B2 NHS]|uniref:hypothetical protein n=1 Tax=Fredinandcohnia sp. 179-A 10B2 NHS TaxID=3235176 RepID=UPI0039A3328C